MQLRILQLTLSLAALALLLRECHAQVLLKAFKRDPGIIGTNVALVCEYSPANVPFNYVQWAYSRLNDVNSRVKVYQYDRQGWAQSFEHLTGRSSHKHTHDKIQLDIFNTRSDDDGIYYCTYEGISPKTANLTYTTISEATKCLKLDSRQERIVQSGNDVVIQASSMCCKPPIRFLWDGVDSTFYSPCAVDREPFLQSSTQFTRSNVQQDFEVTLTTKHPMGDLTVKYRVKTGPACSAAFSGATTAALALIAVVLVVLLASYVTFLLYLRDEKKFCFNKKIRRADMHDDMLRSLNNAIYYATMHTQGNPAVAPHSQMHQTPLNPEMHIDSQTPQQNPFNYTAVHAQRDQEVAQNLQTPPPLPPGHPGSSHS